jgi:hypothetical protein
MDPAVDLIFQPIDNTTYQPMYGTFGNFPPEPQERTNTLSFSQNPFKYVASLISSLVFVGLLLWFLAHPPMPEQPYSSLS